MDKSSCYKPEDEALVGHFCGFLGLCLTRLLVVIKLLVAYTLLFFLEGSKDGFVRLRLCFCDASVDNVLVARLYLKSEFSGE